MKCVVQGRRSLVAFVIGVACALTGSVEAEQTHVPGTKVTLDPPEGFTIAEQFIGFQRLDPPASITVTEISGPFLEVSAGMTKEALERQGMILLQQSELVVVDGQPATLCHVTHAAGPTTLEKWIVLFGDSTHAIMIVAGFPQSAAASLSGPMKRAVLSATWNPAQRVDPFEGLPFRLTETSSLKVARRVSNGLVLTQPGAAEGRSPGDALLIVSTALNNVDIQDLPSFTKQRLASAADITDLTNLGGTAQSVDGLPAFEITADAKDANSGAPLRVYALVVADDRKYFLVQGRVGAERGGEVLPQFSEVAASLRRPR